MNVPRNCAFLLKAIIPASTQTAFNWAPLNSSVERANSRKFTSKIRKDYLFILIKIIINLRKEGGREGGREGEREGGREGEGRVSLFSTFSAHIHLPRMNL